MLSIGEFSAITRLSVKTLRYYDEIGLLPAAAVDPSTGYRRYGIEQAELAEVIRTLRDVDVPLGEITEFLADRDDPVRTQAHLSRQRERLQQRLDDAATMLRYVERLMNKERPVPYVVGRKQLPALPIATMRDTFRIDDANEMWRMSKMYIQIAEHLTKLGYTDLGGGVHITHSWPFSEEMDYEVGYLTPEPIEPTDMIHSRVIEATSYVTTIHVGPYQTIGAAFVAIHQWLQREGLEPAGLPLTINHVSPAQTREPHLWCSELLLPFSS